jgi:hypothetical protein
MIDFVRDHKGLEYHKYGTFSIQDYVRLSQSNPLVFPQVELYTPE